MKDQTSYRYVVEVANNTVEPTLISITLSNSVEFLLVLFYMLIFDVRTNEPRQIQCPLVFLCICANPCTIFL